MIHKGIYRHFKGGIYEVIGVAIHTETQDGLVLYKDVNNPHNIIWARPVSMWNDLVNGKPRFQLITEGEIGLVNVKDNKVNLCDSCRFDYPTCPPKFKDIAFGDGKGNDNVCMCSSYIPVAYRHGYKAEGET